MKIVFTVNAYYPLKGGVQFVTQYHAENLVKKGNDVIVITPSYGNDTIETYNGVKIFRVNAQTKYAIYFGEKNIYQQLILKETQDADALINVCTQNPMTDWCYPLLKKIKCRKVLYMHGMYDFNIDFASINSFKDICHKIWNTFRWGLYYKRKKKVFKLYDKIIQLHRFDLGYTFFKKKYNIDCEVIENAADDAFFKNIDRTKNEDKYAICVSNYIPRKNQKLILNAFYKSKISSEIGLILIGSEKNSYYDKLLRINNQLEKKYGKKKVKILVNIDRKNTIELIKDASLYLLGSKWEAFPISIVEAMASGLPFISTNVGCVRFFPGGAVVNNEEEMIYWIELLLNNDIIRNEFGNIGYDYAKDNMTINNKVNELGYILEK